MLEARAFILVAPCDAPTIARRPCIVPEGRPRSVLVLRRSRRACLHGACARARLATLAFTVASGSLPSSASRFRDRRPSTLSLRVHDQELLVAYTFSCLPRSPLDEHGQHSIGSQSTGSRIRVTFRRAPATILFLSRIAPASRTRPLRPPSPFDDGACPAVGPAIHVRLATFTSRSRRTMILSNHRRACVHLSLRTGSRRYRIDRISRRSRPAGTSVLTFAQRSRRLPRRSSHPVLVLRRSRAGTLSAIHVHAPVQSHLIDTAVFRLQHRGHRDLPAPASSRCPAPFGTNHPAMSSTSRTSNTFRRQTSRGAA
jgi:hypothetical protein